MRIMLVGGAVRDHLLGHPPGDKDYLVLDAGPEDVLRRFPNARQVGHAFPVFLVDGVEYALPRGGTLESDLAARDLTINALAMDEDGVLHAHPQALEDVENRVLRPASPTSLAEDPLRVFRAARFAARLPDFRPAPELLRDMAACARRGLLNDLAAERVGMELRKALTGPAPGRFPLLLAEADCLLPWFAELEACRGVPAGPPQYHTDDVLAHLAEVMDRLATPGADGPAASSLLVWMGLAHDLGKALTPREKHPAHHGHEALGRGAALALASRLRLPDRYAKAGALAAAEHMLAARYGELRPGTRVDLLARLDAAGVARECFALARADHGLTQDADHTRQALADLETILAVRLPEAYRNLGPESGRRLRELRAAALAAKSGVSR